MALHAATAAALQSACPPRLVPPPCYLQVNLFLAVLKHRFATASKLYSKAVTSHGKPRSTVALAWQALRARFQRHMATQRGLFEERMSQRSSRSASVRSPGNKDAAGQVGMVKTGLVGMRRASQLSCPCTTD